MALLQSATKGNAVGDSITSAPCPEGNTARRHEQPPKVKARKPVGGFVFLTVIQLCLLWWLYRSKQITPLDLRIWFACQELQARRCQTPGRIPHFTVDEVRRVVRLRRGPHYITAALARLDTLGLLTFSAVSLGFATSPTDLQRAPDLTGYHAMLPSIANTHRRVPVPRQIVRLIAHGCGRIRLATLLGHLLHCLYYRDGRCVSGGRCKAGWIATVFGVDRRHVKGERKHLLAIGLLQAGPQDDQRLLNRHGPWTSLNLRWTQAGLQEASTRCTDVQGKRGTPPPPPLACATTWPPPPCRNQEPLQEHNHQKPARQAETGRATLRLLPAAPALSTAAPGVQVWSKENPTPAVRTPPTMRHIVQADLTDPDRAVRLCDDARTRGLIGQSEAELRAFFAQIVHARTHGTSNPPGLLAANIRAKRAQVLTDGDDDGAQSLYNLYRSRHGSLCSPLAPPAPCSSPPLSSAVWIAPAPLREDEQPHRADVRAAIEASLAQAQAAIACAFPTAPVREVEPHGEPARSCARCGRDWWQPDGTCAWCLALAVQARLEEQRQLYPVGQAWNDATAEEGSYASDEP